MLNYRLKIEEEVVGDTKILVECIANLEEAIDELIGLYEKGLPAEELDYRWPYFGVIWPSARALLREVKKYQEKISKAKVLEIGCGLAIPSLLACKFGGDVTVTDFHPDVLKFLERNLAINNLANIVFKKIDWRKEKIENEKYDFIICSDVLYESHQPKIIAHAISSQLSENGIAILTDPGRQYLQDFSNEMRALGFKEELKIVDVKDHAEKREIFVITLQK